MTLYRTFLDEKRGSVRLAIDSSLSFVESIQQAVPVTNLRFDFPDIAPHVSGATGFIWPARGSLASFALTVDSRGTEHPRDVIPPFDMVLHIGGEKGADWRWGFHGGDFSGNAHLGFLRVKGSGTTVWGENRQPFFRPDAPFFFSLTTVRGYLFPAFTYTLMLDVEALKTPEMGIPGT